MTNERSKTGEKTAGQDRVTDEQARQFHPIGEQEGTEDAEFRGHDRGTESSAGEPEEASGRH